MDVRIPPSAATLVSDQAIIGQLVDVSGVVSGGTQIQVTADSIFILTDPNFECLRSMEIVQLSSMRTLNTSLMSPTEVPTPLGVDNSHVSPEAVFELISSANGISKPSLADKIQCAELALELVITELQHSACIYCSEGKYFAL